MSEIRGPSRTKQLCGQASLLVLSSALSIGLTGAALAQGGTATPAPTAPVPSQIETVTVTAEFRRSNLQDTPLAITAVNAAMLEARSQTNVAQITAQAPNVSLRPAGSAFGNSLVAYIRGIGQTDFNPSVEPGVGIYVDDVYYSTITGNVLDLLDLDRVEVLRGPQGTLAGRNAIGGAIKLFTRKPDGSNDGFIEATYGKFDRVDFKGAAGFTIIPDKVFARVAGTSRTRDGYVERVDYACANRNIVPFTPGTAGYLPTYTVTNGCKLGTEGGQSYTSGRLALRWVASDDFEINIAGSFLNDDSEVQAGVLKNARPIGPVPIFFDNNGNGTYEAGFDVQYDSRFVTGGTYRTYATYIDDGRSTPSPLFAGGTPGADLSVYKPYVVPPVNSLKSWDASVNIDWQLSENVSFLSVSSYRTYTNSFAEDSDGSPLAVQQLLQRLKHRQWSQEVRLNALLFDGFADVTIGGFYLDQQTNEDARVDLPYVGFDFIHGPDLVPSTNQAVYGHITFHPFEKLDVSAGVRVSQDEKSYTFHRHNPDMTAVAGPPVVNPFFFAGNPANSGVFGVDGIGVSYSSDRVDWRGAVSYDLTDDVMIYGQVATGYKGGGNNARPFFPTQLNAFDPETLTSYEAGFKSILASQLRLNIAGFWNVYKSIQLPSTVCTWAPTVPFNQQVPCASQNNVGDAHVWGIEVETEWHPTDAVTIDASYSYLNFEYQEIDPGATSVTLTMVPPYTPETKWSIGAQYEFPFGELGTITPRLDVAFQDDIFTNATNAPINKIEAYTLANARLTWRSPDDTWSAALEVTNLADEYYYVTLFDLDGPVGYVHGQPGHPREWAVTLKRKF